MKWLAKTNTTTNTNSNPALNVCVFCGSSPGDNPLYGEFAKEFGSRLVSAHCTLIYGGGNVGLMGILADSMLSHKGHVIGVIPDFLLKREVAHHAISRLEVVSTMHERKMRMAELSDAFVALPGGWGTLDELAEILTWKQLGLIDKPVYILNQDGFFDHLISQMQRMTDSGFLHQSNFDSLGIARSVDELMPLLISSSHTQNISL